METRSKILMQILCIFLTFNFVSLQSAEKPRLTLSTNDLTVIKGESKDISLFIPAFNQNLTIKFLEDHEIIKLTPNDFVISSASSNRTQNVNILGVEPGHAEVTVDIKPSDVVDDSNVFIRVIVANSSAIILISLTVGWIYFAAWSISFYPQIWYNFRRRSVVGLNFDFLALNLLGHTLYAIFNCSLYWIGHVEDEYFARHPRGLNPVELNDVLFSIHASVITAFTIGQCFIYERAEQRVSNIARGIIGIFFTVLLVSFIVTFTGVWHWLDFLNVCSYIKLAITLIKYVPQAVMNYQRKSTVGWSIGNILLDFTGGTLSMLQIILNSYNYNDWQSIFGDPTKFGLGLFSVLFDIVFIVQHYFLYRKAKLPADSSRSNLTAVEAGKDQRY